MIHLAVVIDNGVAVLLRPRKGLCGPRLDIQGGEALGMGDDQKFRVGCSNDGPERRLQVDCADQRFSRYRIMDEKPGIVEIDPQ